MGTRCPEHAAERATEHAAGHNRRWSWSWALLGVLATLVFGLLWISGVLPRRPPRPPPAGVTYAKEIAGNWDIYRLIYDTNKRTRLTKDPKEDRDPSTTYTTDSPIVFSTNRDGNFEIYVMGHNGGSQKRLTFRSGDDRYPDWSPRRTHIVFVGTMDGNEEIYVMKADGSGLMNLTNNLAQDTRPAWANVIRLPSGNDDTTTPIAFVSNRETHSEIYTVMPDGSGLTRLTNTDKGANFSPQWSPDGTRLAFVSTRDGNQEIYVMKADGSNQTRLTNDSSVDEAPRWSPNGLRINFQTAREGTNRAYSMFADGTDQKRAERQAP